MLFQDAGPPQPESESPIRCSGPRVLRSNHQQGTPLRHSNFTKRIWAPALERAGLQGLRIHDLRHTAASLMIPVGAHPKAIQTQLGHSSITVTMDRYGHLSPSDQDDIAARLGTRHQAANQAYVDRMWTDPGSAGQAGASRFARHPSAQGFLEWARQDSNLRPTDYESAALTN